MENLSNLINAKFGEEFANLKFLEIVYNTNKNECTISFLYPENALALAKEQKERLTAFLTEKLALNARLNVRFQKSYLDKKLIQNAIISFFKTNRASLSSVVNASEIDARPGPFGVEIEVVLPEKVHSSINLAVLEEDIKKYLSAKFIADFVCTFKAGQNLDFVGIQQKINDDIVARAKQIKPTNRYKVFDVYKVAGNEITPEPEYMANIRDSKTSVILAGKVQNFAKKTYKRIKKDVEVEKVYYKFSLHEENRYIKMIYFCPKAYVQKMDKLADGTEILVIADIKKENNTLNGYVRSLSLCQINEVVRRHNKEKITAYQTVFPQKYETLSQANIFDVDKHYNQNISNNTFVVFDVETTGLDADSCEIIEIGAVKISGGRIIEKFQSLVKPKKQISSLITEITGITNQMVADAPKIEPVIKDFFLFAKNTILAGYNVGFDMKFIQNAGREFGVKFENEVQDVMVLARQKVVSKNYKLGTIVKTLNLTLDNAHRAFFDALATAEVLLHLSKME